MFFSRNQKNTSTGLVEENGALSGALNKFFISKMSMFS